MLQVNAVSTLNKFLQVWEEEVGQRTFKAQLPHTGESARPLDKRGYILEINGR